MSLRSILSNDTVQRAVRTFVQAAVATVLVTQDWTSKAAVTGAVAAGISAVWNSVVVPWLERRKA